MADEKPDDGGPMKTVIMVAVLLGALITLWYYNGGPERSDLRGIFLAPPPPLGSGDAYGPQLAEPETISPQTMEYDY